MKFWDSSAIIPLCLEEPNTRKLIDILSTDRNLVVWWGSSIECYSALIRLKKEKAISESEWQDAQNILKNLEDSWIEIQPISRVKEFAERILRLHSLKAADSFQLAAALLWAQNNPSEYDFVTFDNKLKIAAMKEGFKIFPE